MTVKSYNRGHCAGKKSASYDLGTTDRPLNITQNNILDLFLNLESVAIEDSPFLDPDIPSLECIVTLTRKAGPYKTSVEAVINPRFLKG